MKPMKSVTISIIVCTLTACASSAPKQLPNTVESNCMTNVFEKIKTVRSNTKEQFNSSKETQCFIAAQQRSYWSNIRNNSASRSSQNAVGNVVIQQSINIENSNA